MFLSVRKIIVALLAMMAILPVRAQESEPFMNKPEGSAWVLVPDSLVNDVKQVIDGKKIITRDPSLIDLDEKVLVNGDTVPMYLKERNIGRFNRGLYNHLLVPRGLWQFGLTASYGEFNASDYQIFDLLSDFDFNGHTFSIKPYVSYFIKDNLSVGMRLGYTSAKATLGALAVDFDEDLNFSISDAFYSNESYTAAVFCRQYIGLTRKGRFGVFNEAELSFSSSHGDFRRVFAEKPKLTQTTGMEARLSFSPGVAVYIMKNACFNVSFGVLGFYVKSQKQRTDGVESGRRTTTGANFKFNIFNINFGLGIQI